MKRKIHIYLKLIILAGMIAACSDDFLDNPPQGLVTQENFPETEADALAATNAVYEVLRMGGYHRGFYPLDDIMSDDATKGSNPGDQAANLNPINNFTFNATNTFINNWWQTLYVGIRRANVVIERVPRVEMDEALKNRYIGEAKFLRALFYSDLARGYGGVPLVTRAGLQTGQERATLDATYNLITTDLRDAIEVLPLKSSYAAAELGRATQGAAKALLSRVYLYTEQYDSALLFAEEVINSEQYDLEEDFEMVFSEATEFGQESVFEIGAIGVEGDLVGGPSEYTTGQGVRGVPNRGFGFNRPTLDLINSFAPGDPRMEATVIFLGEVLDGIEIQGDPQTPDETRNASGELIEMETYNQKIWVPGTTVFSNKAHNRRLIRYAEVLLNAAEALNELGRGGDALVYLNEVRERARGEDPSLLPDITITDQAQLRDLIMEERRHELALEGFRFWDLVRKGMAPEVLGPLGFVEGTHEVLPIPQTEIDITQGALEQNPGYN